MGHKEALMIMDFQNDFCTPQGIGAEYRGDMARLQGPAERIPKVIAFARQQGIEVIFVQFIGDEKYQKPNWRDRDRKLNKRPKCCENSWGADFYKLVPEPSEQIFKKYAHFDAFLCAGFEEYLKQKGIEELVFAGVYSDVCLDSTARTAFQKGYYITVIRDCTTSLHLDFEASLAFMKRVYGAELILHTDFLAGT